MSEGTPIDKILEGAKDHVVRKTVREKRGHWTIDEIQAVAAAHPALKAIMTDLEKRYGPTLPEGPWHIDQIVLRYMRTKIGVLLRDHDENGLRVYESHSVPGEPARYMLLSAMTAANFLASMEQARTQERSYQKKGEGYHILLEELEKVGPNATAADVWDKAIPRIREYRSRAA